MTRSEVATQDELVYRRLAPELIRFAQALVGYDDAADVLATAFMKAMASPSWPTVVEHRPYLYRTVFNEAQTLRRRRGRRAEIEARGGHRPALEAPEVDPAVLDAVRRLPLQQRAVVVLTYWSDLPPAEVARRLGIAEGSVRRHLARARARLRKVLDER